MKSSTGKLPFILLIFLTALLIGALTNNAQVYSAGHAKGEPYSTETALQWFGFDEGMAKAKAEDKIVLVDVFTDWCRWCKEMDKNVYTDKSVIDFMNKHYIAIKLDAESDEEIKFEEDTFTKRKWSLNMGVTGYPSTIFFEPNGTPITLLPGYVDAPLFLEILKYVSSGAIKQGIAFDKWQNNKGLN